MEPSGQVPKASWRSRVLMMVPRRMSTTARNKNVIAWCLNIQKSPNHICNPEKDPAPRRSKVLTSPPVTTTWH